MKTTALDLERRVNALPPDFAEHVVSHKGSVARVKSFSSDTLYTVSIIKGPEEGELSCTCNCASTKVCVHITSFYAAAKGLAPDTLKPDEGQESPSEETPDGLKLIAGAIEQLTEGIYLVISERMKEK